jgi:hypothetical protein
MANPLQRAKSGITRRAVTNPAVGRDSDGDVHKPYDFPSQSARNQLRPAVSLEDGAQRQQ